MGFKINKISPPSSKELPTKLVKSSNSASTIMKTMNHRIEKLQLPYTIKSAVKRSLFKILASESVSTETGLLKDIHSNLLKVASDSPSIHLLISIVKDMYLIAVDKQIDQHVHQSSKHIDHLSINDQSFFLYTLSQSIFPPNSSSIHDLLQFSINLTQDKSFDELYEDDNDEEDDYNEDDNQSNLDQSEMSYSLIEQQQQQYPYVIQTAPSLRMRQYLFEQDEEGFEGSLDESREIKREDPQSRQERDDLRIRYSVPNQPRPETPRTIGEQSLSRITYLNSPVVVDQKESPGIQVPCSTYEIKSPLLLLHNP